MDFYEYSCLCSEGAKESDFCREKVLAFVRLSFTFKKRYLFESLDVLLLKIRASGRNCLFFAGQQFSMLFVDVSLVLDYIFQHPMKNLEHQRSIFVLHFYVVRGGSVPKLKLCLSEEIKGRAFLHIV